MNGRRSIIVIEDFYTDPDSVREYALRQKYYLPYQNEEDIEAGKGKPKWWASWYKQPKDCPFKSSPALVEQLELAVGERIDMEHWNNSYPVNERSKPQSQQPGARDACLWHCCFHVKLDSNQKLGQGVHNHVTDHWNSVGPQGWAGLIYLAKDAPLDGGLHLWRNIDPDNTYDWMTPASNWEYLDRFANLYNRLILVRGSIPHSGANGWGDAVATGRMFQTFFFKTRGAPRDFSVSVNL